MCATSSFTDWGTASVPLNIAAMSNPTDVLVTRSPDHRINSGRQTFEPAVHYVTTALQLTGGEFLPHHLYDRANLIHHLLELRWGKLLTAIAEGRGRIRMDFHQ